MDCEAEKIHSRRGLHGYSHENPVKMNLEQQHAILDKTYKDLTNFCGKPPRGNVRDEVSDFSFRREPVLSLETSVGSVCFRDRFQVQIASSNR